MFIAHWDYNLHTTFPQNCSLRKMVEYVPFKQDEEKWIQHYLKQAMRQIKPQELMRDCTVKEVSTTVISATQNAVEQAESEMKTHKSGKSNVYAPIKARPEFVDVPIHRPDIGQCASKRKKNSNTKKKTSKRVKKDIFD